MPKVAKIRRPNIRPRWTLRRITNLTNKILQYCEEASQRKPKAIRTGDDSFTILAPDFPTLQDCMLFTGYNSSYVNELAKKYPILSAAIKKLKEIQEKMLIENGLNKNYAPAFAIFSAKNLLHWKDTPLIDQSVHTHYSIAQLAKDVALSRKVGTENTSNRLEGFFSGIKDEKKEE